MSSIVKWLLRQWHGTPIPHAREPVPPLDSPGDLESLARLLEAKDFASFEEAARRLQDKSST